MAMTDATCPTASAVAMSMCSSGASVRDIQVTVPAPCSWGRTLPGFQMHPRSAAAPARELPACSSCAVFWGRRELEKVSA